MTATMSAIMEPWMESSNAMEDELQLAFQLQSLDDAATEFVRCRQNTVKVLRDLVAYLTKHHANAQTAKVVGSTAGLVGSGLTIGGFVAAFFTFGASLAISAVGAGIGAAGGLTTVGGMATEAITSKITEKGVQKALEDDNTAYQKFLEALGRLKSTWEDMGAAVMGVRSATVVGHGLGVVGGMVEAGAQAASVGKAAGQTAFKTASAAGRGLAITGVVFSVVAIPIDLYTLVTSAENISSKTVPELAKEIEKIAEELPCPSLDEMKECVFKLRDEYNVNTEE
ncbi:cell invasion protein SipB-like [Patiria miniata]|uniref:Apolipoprotein L3 n=1 Tax=Patiria miniata TaxID=46514 RepID=A0A914AZZ3_PATMI|nr:cell invasion protein SipB-like [Patiria miniata]